MLDPALYVVATPIGNLEDFTLRALRILKEVDVIACEDTRVTAKLLRHFAIEKRLLSCRSANELASANGLIKLLKQAQSVAYLSDAGTPGISDPGAILIREVREAGYPVIPLPGASALSCLLSVAAVRADVLFAGFLPSRGSKRLKRLQMLLDTPQAIVIYESPYRIMRLLQNISEIDSQRKIFLAKEMTKKFSTYNEGTAETLLEKFSSTSRMRGEYSLLVHPSKKKDGSN